MNGGHIAAYNMAPVTLDAWIDRPNIDVPLGYGFADLPPLPRAGGGFTGMRVDSRERCRQPCNTCGGAGIVERNVGADGPPRWIWRPCHDCGDLARHGANR